MRFRIVTSTEQSVRSAASALGFAVLVFAVLVLWIRDWHAAPSSELAHAKQFETPLVPLA
jgi:hypothetical protein